MGDPVLNQCPFCGNDKPQIVPNNIGDFYVICRADEDEIHCGARTSDANCEWPEKAILRWNQRAGLATKGPAMTDSTKDAETARSLLDRWYSEPAPWHELQIADIDAALQAARAQERWQPIETAPKDGKRIMLYRPAHGVVFGQWDDDKYAKKPRPFWDHDQIRLWGRDEARGNPPTHWQPVPEPPAAAIRAGETE